jgi:tripartite-type tricarboxylate transporter receptor subunit TctC
MDAMKKRQVIVAALAAFTFAALPIAAQAQEYPSRHVTLVVPLAAGTGMDTAARIYGEELSKRLGKPVVIENQPGAAMMTAASAVARATPDGHTLLVAAIAPMAINQTLYKQINYDPDKDFTPIALYAKSPFVLVVNPASGINTVADFMKKAKESAANPISYSTPGAGFLQHLTMEHMKQQFKFDAVHVPYKSSPQAISDVVGGHVQSSIAEMGASLGLIREGKLKALATTSLTRLTTLPDVPTIEESTGLKGYEAVSWHVLLAPSGTPRAIVDRLHKEIKAITGDAEYKKKIAATGLIPIDTESVEGVTKYIRSERERWSGVVKQLGLAGSQ